MVTVARFTTRVTATTTARSTLQSANALVRVHMRTMRASLCIARVLDVCCAIMNVHHGCLLGVSGTAAKPGHCIAATYNVSIQPCSSDPAKQQWTYVAIYPEMNQWQPRLNDFVRPDLVCMSRYESDTQHFRLTSSGK